MAKKTAFTNGINLKLVFEAGGTAGAHSIDSSFGVEVGDVVTQAGYVTVGTDGTISAAADLTSEVTSPVATANTISTSTTNTTGSLLFFLVYDKNAAV